MNTYPNKVQVFTCRLGLLQIGRWVQKSNPFWNEVGRVELTGLDFRVYLVQPCLW